jgi:hypothetical protein
MMSTFDQLLLYKNPDAMIITTPTGSVMYCNHGTEFASGLAGRKMLALSPSNSNALDERLIR